MLYTKNNKSHVTGQLLRHENDHLSKGLIREASFETDSIVTDEELDAFHDFDLHISDSDSSSSNDEDFNILNEENEERMMKRIKFKINQKGLNVKFQFIIKCLNLLLLSRADPFLA